MYLDYIGSPKPVPFDNYRILKQEDVVKFNNFKKEFCGSRISYTFPGYSIFYLFYSGKKITPREARRFDQVFLDVLFNEVDQIIDWIDSGRQIVRNQGMKAFIDMNTGN